MLPSLFGKLWRSIWLRGQLNQDGGPARRWKCINFQQKHCKICWKWSVWPTKYSYNQCQSMYNSWTFSWNFCFSLNDYQLMIMSKFVFVFPFSFHCTLQMPASFLMFFFLSRECTKIFKNVSSPFLKGRMQAGSEYLQTICYIFVWMWSSWKPKKTSHSFDFSWI